MHVLRRFAVASIFDKHCITRSIVRIQFVVDDLPTLVRYTKHCLYLRNVTSNGIFLTSQFNCIFKGNAQSWVDAANKVKMCLICTSSEFAHFNPQPVTEIMHEPALVNFGPLLDSVLIANGRKLAIDIAKNDKLAAGEFEAGKSSPKT